MIGWLIDYVYMGRCLREGGSEAPQLEVAAQVEAGLEVEVEGGSGMGPFIWPIDHF
jgi:hypothetical protein